MEARSPIPHDHSDAWMAAEFEPGLVSVVIPAYNRAGLLPRTLDSVLAQTYRPLEVIVIDDGSSDDTLGVAQRWALNNAVAPDFRMTCHEQVHLGVSCARNFGLRLARGAFIQFLDSDDELLRDKIRHHVAILDARPELGFVWCPVIVRRDDRDLFLSGRPMAAVRSPADLTRYHWTVMGPLYRRHVCVAAGPWQPGVRASQDLIYDARVKALGVSGYFDGSAQAIWHLHAGPGGSRQAPAISAQATEQVAGHLADLLSQHGITDPRPWNDVARYYTRAGLVFGAGGDRTGQRRCLVAAGQTAHGAMRWLFRLLALIASAMPARWLNRLGHLVARGLRLLRRD